MINQPHVTLIEEWQECRPLGVRPDGALVVNLGGLLHELDIAGIELPEPPPAAYFALVDRLRGLSKPMRCRVTGRTETGRIRAEVLYFAWQDKSGDVWISLSNTLIDQGLARRIEVQTTAP